jgi:hypothetical protein
MDPRSTMSAWLMKISNQLDRVAITKALTHIRFARFAHKTILPRNQTPQARPSQE